MFANLKIIFLFFLLSAPKSCEDAKTQEVPTTPDTEVNTEQPAIVQPILPAANDLSAYLPLLQNKRIAMVVNQTSSIGSDHLVDVLLGQQIDIKRIFAPEHGFRGKADAGEQILDGKDAKTGLPLISLYGKKKKPVKADLQNIDLLVFDIQDVGARFYTYISSMHYVMEACAENGIPVLILDRPNPNGHYVDGPMMEKGYESFVGLHPIPIVHGMTVGEYAQMINGEGWLANGIRCDLQVIPCQHYDHTRYYHLPIKPSPNLPNPQAIYLYPSLCLFEGTTLSVGRGTTTQFQVYGHPELKTGNHTFRPKSMEGAKYPKHEGQSCKGFDLSNRPLADLQAERFNLTYLISAYRDFPNPSSFFLKNRFFDKLAGGKTLRKQIEAGKTEEEIRASWQMGLKQFKAVRKQYLLYNDFE